MLSGVVRRSLFWFSDVSESEIVCICNQLLQHKQNKPSFQSWQEKFDLYKIVLY